MNEAHSSPGISVNETIPGGESFSTRPLHQKEQAILNALPAHIALIDRSGFILSVNENWHQFADINPLQTFASGVGQNYPDLCDRIDDGRGVDGPRVATGIRCVLSGEMKNFSLEYECPDREEERWFRLMVSPLAEGRREGAVVMHIDITDRKKAEAAVSEHAHLMDLASQVARLGAWALEFPGPRLVWGPEVCRIHEVPLDFLPDLDTALSFYPPTSRAKLQAALASGQPYDLELEFVTAKGRQRWIRTTSAVEVKDGVLKRYYGIFQDITDQKLTEEALRQSEEHHRLLFQSSPVPMWVYDLETFRFLSVNQQAIAHYGYSEAEFLKMTIRDIRPPEDIGRLEQVVKDIPSGTTSFGIWRHRQKSGANIDVEISSETIIYHGRPARLVLAVDITERKKTEAKSRESEERFRLLARASNDAIWDWDLIANALWWNDGLETLFGFTREEAGTSLEFWAARVHPDDRDRVVPSIHHAVESGRGNWSAQYRFQRKGGDYAHVLDRGHIIRDEEGKAIRMIGGMTDLTDRIEAEEKLHKSEALLRMASGAARLGGWTVDLPDRRVTFSEEQCLLHDLPPGTPMTLEQAFAFRLPEYREKLSQVFEACAREGIPYDVESEIITAKGRRVWLRSIGQAERNAAGQIIRVQGAVQDVTEQKRAEETLRASEERFASAFEFAAIGVALVDLDGRWLKVNRAICELVGYSEAELLKLTFQDITHPEDLEVDMENVGRLLSGRMPSYQMEKRYVHRDGRVVSVLLSVSLVRDGKGDPLYFISQIQDITERKRAELDLFRTNRALKMLSNCSDTLIRAEHEKDLLDRICRIAVEIGGYRMAWVGYARDDIAKTIEPMAFAGQESGYLSGMEFSWSEAKPSGMGPAGRTIRSSQSTVCEDTSTDPSFSPWSQSARERGYHGVIALPLREKGRTFGLLALYVSEVVSIGDDEVKLLQELADDLAFGINNLRSREQRQRVEGAVLKIAASVSASAGKEFFDQLARNMASALGAHGAIISRMVPGDPISSHTLAAVVNGVVLENFKYPVLGTPSEGLLDHSEWVVKNGIREHFPDSPSARLGAEAWVGRRLENSSGQLIGAMFVLFNEPLHDTDFIVSILQIFAVRAAAEMERQRADDHMREQAALLDAASDAIVLRDMDQRILFWSQGAEQLYGWKQEEVLGKDIRDIVTLDPVKLVERIEVLLREGNWRGEVQARNRAGCDLTVDVRLTLIHDQAGKPKSILSINTDITERKKLEAQFLRVQRMESIGTLAGGIAHDLNNVLAPILMSIELLEEKATDPTSLSLLATLKASSRHGADLVQQVLSFARGVDGQRVAVNPTHLMRDIQKIVNDTFPKNVIFDFITVRDLWTVPGDPTQLHQVLMNLCVNARDAMPDGGMLIVDMENTVLDEVYSGLNPDSRPGAYVAVTVADTGMGIPREIRDKIFEPFFTTKEVGKGTGLGLSTTLAIVKSHGGFINLYSETGKGSQFKIYLPAHATGAEEETVAVARTQLPQGQGELILVVDDEEGIRDVAEKTLERFGYRVMLAANGAEAIALYARHREEIAVVLTDMAMPVMDGLATIMALKSLNPQVHIIGSSGLSSNGSIAQAMGAGVEHFVPKPYTAEVLLKTLAKVLVPQGNPSP